MRLKRRLGDTYCCISAFFFFSTSWQAFRVCHHCFHSQMLANNWSAFHSLFHCSHTVSLCVCFFSSNLTECLINSELFLNLRSAAAFVSIISFVVANKDTCSQCKKKKKKIHKGNPKETRMYPTHGERMDNHKGCHFSFVCLATCTLVMQPDGFSLWESCACRSVLLMQGTVQKENCPKDCLSGKSFNAPYY